MRFGTKLRILRSTTAACATATYCALGWRDEIPRVTISRPAVFASAPFVFAGSYLGAPLLVYLGFATFLASVYTRTADFLLSVGAVENVTRSIQTTLHPPI